MILVEFYKDVDDDIKGFAIEGHAGYSEEGSDIVCAAVSMVAQTTALALQELLNIPIKLMMDKGKMVCFIPGEYKYGRLWEDAQLLLRSMKLGLENIAESYKENIKVMEKGV